MRFSRVSGAKLGAVLVLSLSVAMPALAEDHSNQITFSVAGREDRSGESLIYLHNFSGNLNDAGPIMRLGVSNGDEDGGGDSLAIDVLPGYQFVDGDWRLRAFAGVTYVDRDGAGDDGFGGKLLLQLQNKRSSSLYVSLDGSYDTVRDMGRGDVELGGHVLDVIAGPEVSVLGTEDFTRTQVGLFLTDFKLGPLGMTVRGGYSFYQSDTDSKGSPYLGVSATLQY